MNSRLTVLRRNRHARRTAHRLRQRRRFVGGFDSHSIKVLMVNNPPMEERLPRERCPRQDHPGLLQPGRPVRRGNNQQLGDADLRQERPARPADLVREEARRVRPERRPAGHVALLDGVRPYLRRARLRRVVLPGVPQGRLPEGWADHADQPHLAAGRRPGRQGRRRQVRHEGHLPARPARLGRGHCCADHGGQHYGRHLVRQGSEGPGRQPRCHQGDEVLRRSRARAW